MEDFVLENVVQRNREIPRVTFAENVTVLGNIDTTNTSFNSDLDSFMANRVQLSTNDTINNTLKWTGN